MHRYTTDAHRQATTVHRYTAGEHRYTTTAHRYTTDEHRYATDQVGFTFLFRFLKKVITNVPPQHRLRASGEI